MSIPASVATIPTRARTRLSSGKSLIGNAFLRSKERSQKIAHIWARALKSTVKGLDYFHDTCGMTKSHTGRLVYLH